MKHTVCNARGIFSLLLSLAAIPLCAADSFDLRITEVNPATDTVEVTNTANTSFTATGDLPFSHLANTTSVIANGTSFTAGESKNFTVTGLSDIASDLWLYRDTDFSNPAKIINGLQYGSGGSFGRTPEAVTGGKWSSTTDFAALPTGGNTTQASVFVPVSPAGWVNRAATSLDFFGTGTLISNPLPATIPNGSHIVELQTVLSGIASPIGIVQQPNGADRFYVFDQTGVVTLIDNGVVQSTPFLNGADISVDMRPTCSIFVSSLMSGITIGSSC